ncbi:MAG: hypothetical protein Q9219_003485 [cf. Caloplaca sp. 3 TL-2023]
MPAPDAPSWSQAEIASSQSKQRAIPEGEQSKVFSWAEMREIVEKNQLDVIRRKPSERLVYKAWCKDIIAAHGSITAYMCAERLKWTPLPDSTAKSGPCFDCHSQTPFAEPRDFKILRNDWPYGSFAPEITHLIVWSKPRIETDPETGFVPPPERRLIEAFVDRTFVKRLENDDPHAKTRVVWFKNWVALQSVRGLEHIHVLLQNVPEDIVEEWTGSGEI